MPKKHILGRHILCPFIVTVSCEKEVVLAAVCDTSTGKKDGRPCWV